MSNNPPLVDVVRGGIVESCHRGSVVVANHLGEIVFSLGDIDRNIYPRSSLKFLQAIPLVESGAADAFHFTDSEIALACASHSGESVHTDAVEVILQRLGLSIEDLENGPDAPSHEKTVEKLIQSGQLPTRVHQNCSGKHSGMLTLAKHLGERTEGYSKHDHAVQRAWMTTLSELVNLDIASLPWERDGCGMPAINMPIKSLAYGCALYANPETVGGDRELAIRRILQAVADQPLMVAGTDRCCTRVITESKGSVLVKTGAEAVYIAVLRKQGLGVALKIDDGSTRASEAALGAVLKQLGALDERAFEALQSTFQPNIVNSQGHVTGSIVPNETTWPDS